MNDSLEEKYRAADAVALARVAPEYSVGHEAVKATACA
jgi:hypothetical protein